MYYIYENDKPYKLQDYLKKVRLEGNEIKINEVPKLKLIVNENGHKMVKRKDLERREKKIGKVAKKTMAILNKANSKKIVLSKKLKEEEQYKNYLYDRNLDIVDGKFLFSVLAPEALEYLVKKRNIDERTLKIAILANDLNEIVLGHIKLLVHRYKNVTIVTRHITRLKKIQNDLYENEGIVITVTNNKRKALTKINVILNFDFTEEMLNKYSIYEDANIINFNNKVRIYKKRFNGGNIYDYEISMNKNRLEEIVDYKQELIKKNYLKDIYEAQLYKKQSFEFLRKLIKDDKIEINYLLGNNMKY